SRSMLTRSGRTKSSLPSTAPCRPIATHSMARTPPSCCRRRAISFAISAAGRAKAPLPERRSTERRRAPRTRPPAGPLPPTRHGDSRRVRPGSLDGPGRGFGRRHQPRLMRDLGTALALVLVIEGVLYALFPDGMKRIAARAMLVPPQALRFAGLFA